MVLAAQHVSPPSLVAGSEMAECAHSTRNALLGSNGDPKYKWTVFAHNPKLSFSWEFDPIAAKLAANHEKKAVEDSVRPLQDQCEWFLLKREEKCLRKVLKAQSVALSIHMSKKQIEAHLKSSTTVTMNCQPCVSTRAIT